MKSTPPPRIQGLVKQPILLRQFIDELPIGVLVVDPALRVLAMNRALEALTGYLHHEAFSRPCWYILRSNMCVLGCPAEVATERGQSICTEANIVNRSREKIPVRFTAAPILGDQGELLAFVKTVEDMRFLRKDDDRGSRFFAQLIGNGPEMQRIFRILPAIADTDCSVLITGQTGTGKDFVAEAIHQESARAKGPFIKVNCGALPESLLESELFGHEKGAFPGAVDHKPGRFWLADKGTLYLTEIGDLPLNLQVRLLSFLDDHIVHPLGSTRGIHVDVRVIAGTHRDLESMGRQGRFREDLLFRLNMVRLHLPPLADRGEDIGMLVDHFLHVFNSRFKKKVTGLSPDARKIVMTFHYPGNVRELRNIVEYAANLCDGDRILPEHLPSYVGDASPELPVKEDRASHPAVSPVAETTDPDRSHSRQWDLPSEMERVNWREAERSMILDALLKARGHRTKAAMILGWNRSTLWRKMKEHGLVGTRASEE